MNNSFAATIKILLQLFVKAKIAAHSKDFHKFGWVYYGALRQAKEITLLEKEIIAIKICVLEKIYI